MTVDALTVLARLLAAVGFAAVLGIERELSAQPAGLRTHSLVSLGAALFTVVGTEVAGADPSRIAAQVVSGIGFLGGGAILRDHANVRGLTTAATLWAAAAIGLACGLGRYPAAAAAAGIALVVTAGLKVFESAALPRRRGVIVVVTVDGNALRAAIDSVGRLWPQAKVTGITTVPEGNHRVEFRAKPAPADPMPVLAEQLLAVPGILGIELRA